MDKEREGQSVVGTEALVERDGEGEGRIRETHSSPSRTHPPLPPLSHSVNEKRLRSSSSEGQISQRNHPWVAGATSKSARGSTNSLPPIQPAIKSASRRENERQKLDSVKEGEKESTGEIKTPAVLQKEPIRKIPLQSQSFLTALDDVLGDAVAETSVHTLTSVKENVEKVAKNESTARDEVAPKKKGKPDWIFVNSSDSDVKRRTKSSGPLSETEKPKPLTKKHEKIAKLVNSAKECYSQKNEPPEVSQTSRHGLKEPHIDTTFIKRRRNRFDPRNNISSTKSSSKRSKQKIKRGTTKKQHQQSPGSREELSREEEEVLRKIEESAAVGGSESLRLAPERAMEMFEKHQRPNLVAAKRLKLGRRVERGGSSSSASQSTVLSSEAREMMKAEGERSHLEVPDEKPSEVLEGYGDDEFESDGDVLPPVVVADKCREPPQTKTSPHSDDEDDYNDDDEFEEEDHSLSSARLAFSGKLTIQLTTLDDGNEVPAPNSRTLRLSSREKNRSGEVDGIELLSGGPPIIGSAPSSRRSSRKLPHYDNTDPLILASGDPDLRPPSRNTLSSHAAKRMKATTTGGGGVAPADSEVPPSVPSPSPSLSTSPATTIAGRVSQRMGPRRTNLPTNLDYARSPAFVSAPLAPQEQDKEPGTVDSKSHQRMMNSRRNTSMRIAPPTNHVAIPTGDLPDGSSPSLLDINIMKQSGQVRRALKREDSFDKLTRKIAKSLQSSL
jgi:hypothetical protein